MKICHMSDSHLGYKMYNLNERKEDFLNSFKQAIEICIEKNVKHIVHSGDLFHKNNLNPNILKEISNILRRLNNKEIKFYSIVGNHERRRGTQWLEFLEDFELAYYLSSNPKIIEEDNIKVSLYGLDSINSKNLDKIKFKNEKANYNILTIHEILSPPADNKISDYKLKDFMNNIELNPDIILSGDYHKYKTEEYKKTKILYPGSTEKTSFDVRNNYINIIDITDEKINVNKTKLETRDFQQIDFKNKKTSEIVKILENKNFKNSPVLRIKIEESKNINKNKIIKTAEEKGCLKCIIKIKNKQKQNKKISKINNFQDIDKYIKKSNFSKPTKEIIKSCLIEEKDEDKVREKTDNIINN